MTENFYFTSLSYLILFSIILYYLYLFVDKKYTLVSSTEIQDSDVELEKWIDHFKTKHLEFESAGEKALANPWDDCELGIPSNEYLILLKRTLENLEFKININKSFTRDDVPHHFTAVWE